MSEYISYLRKEGKTVNEGTGSYYWINYEKGAVARGPAFILDMPGKNEVAGILKKMKPIVITYNVDTETFAPNSFLYVTSDKSYSLEKLDKNGRRFTRIALRNLDFRFVSWDDVLENGFNAYSDTRSRNGLSDGTFRNFTNVFGECKRNPAFKAIGAFLKENNRMCAFLRIIEENDWVEITSSYSETEYLNTCTNNELFNKALNYYLTGNRENVVSYGVSSIQSESKKEGLHGFKDRAGFEAKPIHRIFLLNPKYKLLVNKVSYKGVRLLLKLFPSDRRLKKIEGVMNMVLYGSNGK